MSRRNEILKKLTTIRQDKSIDEYIQKFQLLAFQSNFAEDILIFWFTNGLTEKLRVEVNMRKPTRLADAFELATICDRSLNSSTYDSNKKENANFASTNKSKPNKNKSNDSYGQYSTSRSKNVESIVCGKCNKVGHTAKNCKSAIKCYKCQKTGHYSRECRTDVIYKQK